MDLLPRLISKREPGCRDVSIWDSVLLCAFMDWPPWCHTDGLDYSWEPGAVSFSIHTAQKGKMSNVLIGSRVMCSSSNQGDPRCVKKVITLARSVLANRWPIWRLPSMVETLDIQVLSRELKLWWMLEKHDYLNRSSYCHLFITLCNLQSLKVQIIMHCGPL